MSYRSYRFLAGSAVVLGFLAMFVEAPPEASQARPAKAIVPKGEPRDLRAIFDEIAQERDHVTAIDLARWIVARRPELLIFDVRSEHERAIDRIPSAKAIDLTTLAALDFPASATVVLYSTTGIHAAQAWALLRAQGIRNVYFLAGGMEAWQSEIVEPSLPAGGSTAIEAERAALSRYFGGKPRSEAAPVAIQPRRRGC